MINKEQKNKLSPQEFDKKYETILNELKGMAKNSPEEKAARFDWIKARPEYDQFIVDIINTSKNNYCEALEKRLINEVEDSIDADAGIATMEKKEIDPHVLMETIRQVIENYTGEEKKGENKDKAPFSALVGQIYKQNAQQAAGKNDLNKRSGGIHIDTPKKNQHYINTFIKEAKQLQAKYGFLKTIEEIFEEIESKMSHKFTKAEREIAIDQGNKLDPVSLDQEVGDGDNQVTLQDQLKDCSQSVEDNMLDVEFWKMLSMNFADKWDEVVNQTRKSRREIWKAFFSKDLLIVLKLEALNEVMRKEYKAFLEPKCGQWCHRKNRCPYSRKDGCYIRYGMREEYKQNGDGEIYDILKTIERLYEKILDNDYVQYAYTAQIDGLQDMYAKPLKPFKDDEKGGTFLFTDAILGEALGEKPSTIAKHRKQYEGETREALFKIFQRT